MHIRHCNVYVIVLEQIYNQLLKNLQTTLKLDPLEKPNLIRDYIDLKI